MSVAVNVYLNMSIKENIIKPVELPILNGLPVYNQNIPLCIKLAGYLFYPLIKWYYNKRKKYAFKRLLPRLLTDLSNCHNRKEIKKLLGNPKYLLNGSNFRSSYGSEILIPDVVEVYENRFCHIRLWFKDNHIVDYSGTATITQWDKYIALKHKTYNKTKNEDDEKIGELFDCKKRELLDKDLNLNNFKYFLHFSFPNKNIPINNEQINEIYSLVNTTSKYLKILDLNVVIIKTQKAREAMFKDVGYETFSSAIEFLIRFALINPEILDTAKLISSFEIELVKKYIHLVDK